MATTNASTEDILKRALRILAALHGRTRTQVIETTGTSRATTARYVALLRKLGVKVQTNMYEGERVYVVADYGPFDPTKIRRALNA